MEKCQNFVPPIGKCASDKERVDRLANKVFPRPLIARDQSAVKILSRTILGERDNSIVSIRASPFARYHCLKRYRGGEIERKDEQAGGRRGRETKIREEGRAL